MVVYCIRHGDKEKGDYYNDSIGQNDQPLSSFGIQQSHQLVHYFESIDIKRIFVSSYKRTFQTIEKVCLAKDIKPISNPLINEIDCGSYSKLNSEMQNKKYPDIVKLLKERNKDFKYPDGESGHDVIVRIKKFFEILGEQDTNAIVVTHEGWLKCLVCYLLNLDPGKRFQLYMNTCGITEIEKYEYSNFWQIKRINQILYEYRKEMDY